MKLSTAIWLVLFLCVPERLCIARTERSASNSEGEEAFKLLSSIVKEGGRRGLQECENQFKNEIWNCTLSNKEIFRELPIFVKTTLPYATRETAFIHAISSAAITHEITLQCRQGKIPGCSCAVVKKQRRVTDDWQWGGCSDDIRYGEKETRRFIDRLENGNDARTAFNLHNNEVGRKVVRSSVQKECKCHGVTGSCSMKTCWRRLVNFNAIGSKLKEIYFRATQVSFENNKLQERIHKKTRAVSKRERKLVYLDSSPDYCLRNDSVGAPGMLGRTCRSDEVSTNKCKSLCNSCKMWHQTQEHYKLVKCKCQFVWCCTVKCEMCSERYSVTTCSRG